VGRPLTIGLTGGIAAGKSEALAALERLGAATISSDAIVHELLDGEPLRGRVVERWGRDVAPGGRIDRSRLGEVVFAQPGELAWLESEVHPLVGARISEWLTSLPERTEVAVVEVPLLFEAAMEDVFDVTLVVIADDDVRGRRAGERGQALVREREERQLSQRDKAGRADHVVRNDGSLEDLERALAGVLGQVRDRG